MGYLNDFEQDLRDRVSATHPGDETKVEELVKFVKEKILDSYRNGAKAAKKYPSGRKEAFRSRSERRE